jgi:hypothetical protein
MDRGVRRALAWIGRVDIVGLPGLMAARTPATTVDRVYPDVLGPVKGVWCFPMAFFPSI